MSQSQSNSKLTLRTYVRARVRTLAFGFLAPKLVVYRRRGVLRMFTSPKQVF